MAKQQPDIINEYHLNQYEPQKPQLAIYDLHAYLKKNQANTTRPHIHSYYQIIWFKSGKGKHFVDFKEYDVFDDTIFFIARNQVHYFDHQKNYRGILLHFNAAFLMQHDNEADYLVTGSLFNNPYQQPYCAGSSIHHLLDEYIQQITNELQNEEDYGKEELLRTYLKAFLIQVQREKNKLEKSDRNASFAINEKRVQLTRFVNLIDQHYNKGLSVAEYAALMHISFANFIEPHQSATK